MSQLIGNQLDRLSVGKVQKRATAVIGLGLFFEFFELFLAGVLSSVLGEEYHVPASIMPLLLGSSFLGMFIGAVFLSHIADRYGRKRAFMLNIGIYSFFTIFIAFSPNVGMVIFFRFLAGMGLGAQPALCDTYLSELIPSQKRGKYIAWAYTLGFLAVPVEGFLSRVLVPLSPLGMDGWRWVFLLGAAGGVFVLMAARALPESPRWLASKGRMQEARALLKRFQEEENEPGVVPEIQTGSADQAPKGNTLRAVFQKRYLKSTAMLYIFQIFQTIGYFGFGTLAPLVLASKGYTITHSLEYIALSFIGYPLGSLLSVPLIEKMDRKWLVCYSAVCMGVFGVLFGIGGSPSLVIVFGFAYTLCSNIFSNAFHVLQAEIFPTEIRASATGMAYSISRIMSGLMPFILLPVLENEGAAVMFIIVAAAMLIVVLDIALLAPKTTGRSLENIENPPGPQMIGKTGAHL
ncbi:MFS transporter [Heyndrickxia acidiproducens]|uniref:MFS transporter n=1 Tax=Heyndrickxia acidiproducens TaxID=1121084 RepID=UPI000361398C|nr:MFS transporter [Heyndrickxia acidiproducens]